MNQGNLPFRHPAVQIFRQRGRETQELQVQRTWLACARQLASLNDSVTHAPNKGNLAVRNPAIQMRALLRESSLSVRLGINFWGVKFTGEFMLLPYSLSCLDLGIISCHPLAPKHTTLVGSSFNSITLTLKKKCHCLGVCCYTNNQSFLS